MPAVQKPHCTAPCSMNASCSGCRCSSVPSPSTVSTSRPSTSSARYVHALTGAPSTSTVHAPHTCMSQERRAPLSCSRSRSTSSSSASGRTSSAAGRPLSVKRRLDDDRMGIAFLAVLGSSRRARGGHEECAFDEDARHVLLVLRRAVQVTGGLHVPRHQRGHLVGVPHHVLRRPSAQALLGLGRTLR